MNKKPVSHLSEQVYDELYENPSQKFTYVLQFLEIREQKNGNRTFKKAVLSDGHFKADSFLHPSCEDHFVKIVKPNDIVEVTMTKKPGQDLMLISEFSMVFPNLKQIVGRPIEYAFGSKNPHGSSLISELSKNEPPKKFPSADRPENGGMKSKKNESESQDEGENEQFAEFASLSQYDKAIKVKGRILKKGDFRAFKTKDGKESGLFNLVLFDGIIEIQGTFFGEVATANFETVQIGKIYSFSDADVRFGDKYNQTKFKFTLTFGRNCEVKKLKDNHEIDVNHFKFMSIKSLLDLEEGTIIDVIGCVQEISSISEITLKTGERKSRRNITIFDDTSHSIGFTLWGDLAINPGFVKNDVIVVQDVTVKDYMGKNLNFGFNSRILTDIPQNQRYRDMILFLNANKKVNFIPSSNANTSIPKLHRIVQVMKESQYLEVNDSKRPYFTVIGFVARVMGNMYYESCYEDNCLKKVEKDVSNRYFCNKCNKHFDIARPRFICTLKIIDDSGSMLVTISGDDNCQVLFGKNIEEIRTMKVNESEFADYVTDRLFEEFRFSIAAKKEVYNNEEKLKFSSSRVAVVENNITGFLKNIQSVLNVD